MRHKATTQRRNEKRLSLQENEDQFKFLQALRRRPPSRHYLSLHLRAMSRLGESRERTPAEEGLDEIDLKNFDRNSMICKAVLILWNNAQRMRAWRKWVDIVAIENKRRYLQYVHQVRKTTLSLLKRGPPYTNDEIATLEEWALKIQTKIFQNIAPNLVRDVVIHMKLSHYRAHDCLFVQGDIGNGYYILFAGTISIYVDMPQDTITKLYYGRAAALEEIQLNPALLGDYRYDIAEGDGFGEVAMFSSDGRRTASAIASTKCDVVEIPKEVYCRTLKKSQYEALSTAQMLAFLPTVDIFADWVHSKLTQLIDLLERRELPFGYELLVADKAIPVVYFILSGEVQLTRMWHSGATSFNPLKPKAHTTLPITVDTITRRGIVGIQSLVEPGVRSKYSALAVTESIDCYVLSHQHSDAFRALLQNTNLVHLRNTWNALEQARQSRYDQAIKALNLSAQPPSPTPSQPQTKLRYHRDQVLPFLPQMTSMVAKKFVFTDFDLLAHQDQIALAPTSLPKMTIPIKPHIPKQEQDRVVAQHFAGLKAQSWDPHQGFLPSTDSPKDKTHFDKVNSIRPEKPALPPFERDLVHTRLKARAVLKQHQSFKSRRIAPEQIVSYKHSRNSDALAPRYVLKRSGVNLHKQRTSSFELGLTICAPSDNTPTASSAPKPYLQHHTRQTSKQRLPVCAGFGIPFDDLPKVLERAASQPSVLMDNAPKAESPVPKPSKPQCKTIDLAVPIVKQSGGEYDGASKKHISYGGGYLVNAQTLPSPKKSISSVNMVFISPSQDPM